MVIPNIVNVSENGQEVAGLSQRFKELPGRGLDTAEKFLENVGIRRKKGQRPLPGKSDFENGFIIEEFSQYPYNTENLRSIIALTGNTMPLVPFEWGGRQRINKTYYPGNHEPSTHIMGSIEDNVTINGQFKAIRFADAAENKKIPEYLALYMDSIRYNGRLCRFALGNWTRWGYIESTSFRMTRLTRIDYSITINVVSVLNPPTNGKLLEDAPDAPFDSLADLSLTLGELQNDAAERYGRLPELNFFQRIDSLIGDVASSITEITNYADNVFDTIDNIRQSVDRMSQLIERTNRKLKEIKKTLFGETVLESGGIITRYDFANYRSSLLSRTLDITELLNRISSRFRNLISNIPTTRHVIRRGDTWQRLSVRYYGTVDKWKTIPDFNGISINRDFEEEVQLPETPTGKLVGTIIDIPRE